MPFSWRRYSQLILLALYYIRATQSMQHGLPAETYEVAKNPVHLSPASIRAINIEPTSSKGIAPVGASHPIGKENNVMYESPTRPARVDSSQNGAHTEASSKEKTPLNDLNGDGVPQIKKNASKGDAFEEGMIEKEEEEGKKEKVKKKEKKDEKDDGHKDPTQELLQVDPVLGFMKSFKTVQDDPELALKTDEMSLDLKDITLWSDHIGTLIRNEKEALIEPFNKFNQQLSLIRLGSVLKVCERLSPEEKSQLTKNTNFSLLRSLAQETEDSLVIIHNDSDQAHSTLSSMMTPRQNVYRMMSDKLRRILHEIGPSRICMGDDFDKVFNKKGILLQINIISTINYMHKYHFITTNTYQDIFKDQTIESVAINMHYSLFSHNPHWCSYHTNEYASLVRGIAPYSSYMMGVLGDSEHTKLSYYNHKAVFSYYKELNFPIDEKLDHNDIKNQFVDMRNQIFSSHEFSDEFLKFVSSRHISSNLSKEEEGKKIPQGYLHRNNLLDKQLVDEYPNLKKTIRKVFELFPQIGGKKLRFLFNFIKFIEAKGGKELIDEGIVNEMTRKKFEIMSAKYRFFEEIDQLKLYLRDRDDLMDIPTFLGYPNGNDQKVMKVLTVDYIENHYQELFTNNQKLISDMIEMNGKENQLNSSEFEEYKMKDLDKEELGEIKLAIDNTRRYLNKKKLRETIRLEQEKED